MSKPYILHIASWYPTKINIFDGDFIQRHIDCIEDYYNVVLHAQEIIDGEVQHGTYELNNSNHKEEHIIYYKPILRFLNPLYQYFYLLKIWKKVFSERGLPVIIHVHVLLYGMLLGRNLKKWYKIPLVATEHSTLYTSQEKVPYRKYRIILSKWISRDVDKILTVSNQLRSKLIGYNFLSKIEVLYNVVPDFFFKTNVKRRQNKKIKFIHVSSLHDQHKNVRGLLSTIKKLSSINPNFECTIVGNHFLQETSKMIQDLEIPSENIALKGPLSHEEVAVEMSRSDVFILFSNFENYPCVLLEAQASGLRLIATDVGGVNEILDKEFDFLIEKKNEQELLDSMIMSINQVLVISDQISENARHKYSKRTIHKQMTEVYESLIL